MVLKRVKLDPTRRSSSWRMSTALASFSFGSRSVLSARVTSLYESAENCALRTRMLGFTCRHTSRTSNAMFSPSRSQSSHRMSHDARRASFCRFSATGPLSRATRFTTGASSMSTPGLHPFQFLCAGSKSTSIRWPVTDVNAIVHCRFSTVYGNSQIVLYCDGPRREGGWDPPFRTRDTSFATEGFSATFSTRMGAIAAACAPMSPSSPRSKF